jgi:hypothetical protein
MITSIEQLDLTKAYTFKDYLSWKFQERVELLRGYIAKMSPAPTSTHQEIAGTLHWVLRNYLQKKSCKVFFAPFDVYLPSRKGEGETVVQPDLCVICDTNKIKNINNLTSLKELYIANNNLETINDFMFYANSYFTKIFSSLVFDRDVRKYIKRSKPQNSLQNGGRKTKNKRNYLSKTLKK